MPTAASADAGDGLGPAFNCTSTVPPLAKMICADKELSRIDLLFNQTYWALLQQIPEGNRQELKAEDMEFIGAVETDCSLPRSGPFPAEASRVRTCVKQHYEAKRAAWLIRLAGPAVEEARRPLQQHVILERKLRELGFLSTPPTPEGVYGSGTRQAITAWQRARGRATTGLLGDMDAMALSREGTITSPPAEAAKPETAPVVARTEPPKAQNSGSAGTAFAINASGEFLTNYHVVKGCSALRLRIAGEWQDGRTVASDERNDLAVIRARNAASVPVLRFRDGKGIRPADTVVALGFPYAGLLTTSLQVTTGNVSALAGIKDDTRFLQLTAAVQPGNSGGPLLDLSGNVVGVVSGQLKKLLIAEATGSLPENVNFAIKSGNAREFLEANRVDYETAQSTNKLEPADVGEMATKSVVMVECP